MPHDQCGEERSHIHSAMQQVIIAVGNVLIKNLAVLFPDVYDFYIKEAIKRSDPPLTETQVRDEMPKRCFLSRLIACFGKHLVYECKQRSCGTLLYRCGCDLELCLARSLKFFQSTGVSFLSLVSADSKPNGSNEALLEDVCTSMNERIRMEIARITASDAASPYDISSFSVDETISTIDPVIWKMIVMLTRTVKERRKNTSPSNISLKRKLHCLYCVCVMFFATNTSCSVPLHVLLTDVIESQGGSYDLIRTLNKFGAVASIDTHRRYVQYQVQKQMEVGLLNDLDRQKFTVVTVDNIDFLQRHAMVYCGDQGRSWHGTTVQVVQPNVTTVSTLWYDVGIVQQHSDVSSAEVPVTPHPDESTALPSADAPTVASSGDHPPGTSAAPSVVIPPHTAPPTDVFNPGAPIALSSGVFPPGAPTVLPSGGHTASGAFITPSSPSDELTAPPSGVLSSGAPAAPPGVLPHVVLPHVLSGSLAGSLLPSALSDSHSAPLPVGNLLGPLSDSESLALSCALPAPGNLPAAFPLSGSIPDSLSGSAIPAGAPSSIQPPCGISGTHPAMIIPGAFSGSLPDASSGTDPAGLHSLSNALPSSDSCSFQGPNYHITSSSETDPASTDNLLSGVASNCPGIDQHQNLNGKRNLSPRSKDPQHKKKYRRSRTMNEHVSSHECSLPHRMENLSDQYALHTNPLDRISANHYLPLRENYTLQDFMLTPAQIKEVKELRVCGFFYSLVRLADGTPNSSPFSLHEFLERLQPQIRSASSYVYLDVLDKNADSRETIADVLNKLQQEFSIVNGKNYLVVGGDAKTYQHLQSLKLDYGEELSWLLPFPGDLHICMNYQPILSKVYFDAGLKHLAAASGFKGETLTALQKCSHFKHAHRFFTGSWEAFLMHMIKCFASTNDEVQKLLEELRGVRDLQSSFRKHHGTISQLVEEFETYIVFMGRKDPNWQFWGEFVIENGFAYVAFFCSIRSGNWDLRVAALKKMAPLFCALDRPIYRRLVPQHIADCLILPEEVLQSLKLGGFSVSIMGKSWHSVGLDEAHEMLINRDCKSAVIHPTKEFVSRMAVYFPFRSKVLKNLKQQINPRESEPLTLTEVSCSKTKKLSENTWTMKTCLETSQLLILSHQDENLCLCNSFTGKIASPQQQHDMLGLRAIGQDDFNTFVEYTYLRASSVKPSTRKHNLKTFSTTRVGKQLVKQVQREKNLVTKCLKSRLLLAQTQEVSVGGNEQYIELPRAIADENGIPHKGQKSHATSFLSKRYQEAFMVNYPPGWIPDCVVLEGMVMIHTTPLKNSNMLEYTTFLTNRYAGWYFRVGVPQVHIVFDNAGRLEPHPKSLERERRDAHHDTTHDHMVFTDDMKIPKKWGELLNCRKCKRRLVVYIGDCILRVVPQMLHGEQRVYIGGAGEEEDRDRVWCTSREGIEYLVPELQSNAEEGDTLVWLHANQMKSGKILIFSPDTDVYHIGLTNVDITQCEIIVHLSAIGRDLKLLHVNHFMTALSSDPALSRIHPSSHPSIMQMLYICTGCDFTSFFASLGKSAFLKSFFSFAQWITSNTDPETPGSLANVGTHNESFLAFLRLVGVAYYAKHRGAFRETSPPAHFESLKKHSATPRENHIQWYNDIRSKVWERIMFEDSLPPSLEALELHWERSLWVSDYWRQACCNNMSLLPPERFGWNIDDAGKLTIKWESEENIQSIRNRVAFLTHGCSCKTGCGTRRCRCLKSEHPCGPGCSCNKHTECKNVPTAYDEQEEDSEDEADVDEFLNEFLTLDVCMDETESEANEVEVDGGETEEMEI